MQTLQNNINKKSSVLIDLDDFLKTEKVLSRFIFLLKGCVAEISKTQDCSIEMRPFLKSK